MPTSCSALLAGVGSDATVGPNTLVSFGAFAQILKAEVTVVTTRLVPIHYNLVVIAPLAFLVAHQQGFLHRIESFILEQWMTDLAIDSHRIELLLAIGVERLKLGMP